MEYERAPYIADKYDGGPFLEYPSRSSCYVDYIMMISFPDPDGLSLEDSKYRDLEAFLQTWLFFGLVYEFFGEARWQDFVETEGHAKCYLTTIKLAEIAYQWAATYDGQSQTDQNKLHLEHLISCIAKAHQTLDIATLVLQFRPSIIWSIGSIVERLTTLLLEVAGESMKRVGTGWFRRYDSDEIDARMMRNGWCPADKERWKEQIDNFATLFYFCKMEQPRNMDHSHCRRVQCVANQSDPSQSKTLHRCQRANCGMLGADLEALHSILDEGCIGLLDVSGEDNLETMHLRMVCSRESHRYVALSHVWADGLGNPASNSLPKCQVAYVARLVRDLNRKRYGARNERSLIWLDTMCCPVASVEHRQSCLILMEQIYREADAVLILDAQINCFQKTDLDSLEICARVVFSRWAQRLWTLQEGAMAKELWIQFADGAVDLDQVMSNIANNIRAYASANVLIVMLMNRWKSLRQLGAGWSNRPGEEISKLITALATRAVTVPSDESLCLCTCMNIDQRNVIGLTSEEGMKAFWLAMGTAGKAIHKNIVFFRNSNLRLRGLRWAPTSLLGGEVSYHVRMPQKESDVATISREGLNAKFAGFACSFFPSRPEVEDNQLRDVFGPSLNIRYVRRTANDWLMIHWNGYLDIRPKRAIAIILDGAWEDTSEIRVLGWKRKDGVLGLTSGVKDGHIRLQSHGPTPVIALDHRQSQKLEIAFQYGMTHRIESLGLTFRTTDEKPLLTFDETLSKLSNEFVSHLLEIAQTAMEADNSFVEKFNNSGLLKNSKPSKFDIKTALQEFAKRLFTFYIGRLGEITKIWPINQAWYID